MVNDDGANSEVAGHPKGQIGDVGGGINTT